MTSTRPFEKPTVHAVRWLLLAVVLLSVAGGAVLCLPACWAGPYPVQSDHPLTRYQFADHALDCVFTAAAALTGTSLGVFDAGHDFNRTGQVVLLVLMQTGGLGVLVLGSIIGWRLRPALGWAAPAGGDPHGDVRPMIVFICIAALAVEAIAAAVLLVISDIGIPASGADFGDRLFAAAFHAVSALCNCGLTLSRDSLIAHRDSAAPCAVLLPLMLIGGIGAPTLYELWRRVTRRSRGLSTAARITLLVTCGLTVAGTGLLFGVESTTRWQLRYPRADTPGRIGLPATPAAPGEIVFSSEDSSRADAERMRTMAPTQRLAAALFQSVASRSGGMRTARLDESSLSPASRVVLMVWMLIGGAVGGTAGGLRIVVAFLLLSSLLRRHGETAQQMIVAAAGIAVSMVLLIGMATLILVYRQAASLEAALFESVSAACNVGLTTGLTRQLAPLAVQDRLAGQLALLGAMLLGRVLPIALWMRCAWRMPRGGS